MIEMLTPQFRGIPDYVFIVSFLILSIFIVVAFMLRKGHSATRRVVFWMLLIEYVLLMFCSTVICRDSHPETTRLELMPFWNYHDVLFSGNPMHYWEVILNILLFTPIGFLLGGVGPRPSKSPFARPLDALPLVQRMGDFFGWRNWGQCVWVVAISAGLSVVTEVLQLLLHRGLCETDDVIHNTIGGLLGWTLYVSLRGRLLRLARLGGRVEHG